MRNALAFLSLLIFSLPASAEKSSPASNPAWWSGSPGEILESLGSELQRLDPKDSRTLARAGELYLRAGNTAKAADLFERAQASDPKDDEAFVMIAEAYSAQEMWAEADPWYQKAVTRDPKDADHLGLWGGSYWQRGDRDKAIAISEKAVKLSGNDFLLHHQLQRFKEAQPLSERLKKQP